MDRKAFADRGVRTVESGFDPGIVPVEDQQAGDEGIDDIRSDAEDQQEALPSPRQRAVEGESHAGDNGARTDDGGAPIRRD